MGENNAENRPADCSEPQTGQDQLWFVDSGCSRHMIDEKQIFSHLLLLKEGVWPLVMENQVPLLV